MRRIKQTILLDKSPHTLAWVENKIAYHVHVSIHRYTACFLYVYFLFSICFSFYSAIQQNLNIKTLQRSPFYTFVLEDCRSLLFLPPISTRALEKHVIKSVNVTREDSCMVQCFGEKRCVSYNIGPIEDGFHQCELSDSDHVQDPQDMKDKPGFSYVTTKVRDLLSLNESTFPR